MPDNTANQRGLLMLWLMIATNRDLFSGTKPVSANATVEEKAAAAAPVLAKLTQIGDLGGMKSTVVTDSLIQGKPGAPGNWESLAAARDLYQSYSKNAAFWPVDDPDHPVPDELVNTFFKP